MSAIRLETRVPNSKLIREALGDVAEGPKRAVLVSAGRIALKPMVKEIRRRAPKDTDRLAESIGVVTSSRRGERYAGNLVVSPRTSGKYNGWYAHIVEGGARGVVKNKGKGVLGKGARYRKDMKAQPFFKPGVEAKIDEVGEIYIASINKALERRIKRLQRAARLKSKKAR